LPEIEAGWSLGNKFHLAMIVVIVKMVYFEDVLGDKEAPIEAVAEEFPV